MSLMLGFKYRWYDSSETIVPLKQQTRVVMIDRKKEGWVSCKFVDVYPHAFIVVSIILNLSETELSIDHK